MEFTKSQVAVGGLGWWDVGVCWNGGCITCIVRFSGFSGGVVGVWCGIRLEAESRNSWEHVEAIRGFAEVTAETPVVVVSSDWHVRRLRMVFEGAFDRVGFVAAEGNGERAWRWGDWWPQLGALGASRLYLREWAAIAWYAVLGRG